MAKQTTDCEPRPIAPINDAFLELVIEKTVRATLRATPPAAPNKILWNEREAAAALGMSLSSLTKLRNQGLTPAPYARSPVRYTHDQLIKISEWCANRTDEPLGCAQ